MPSIRQIAARCGFSKTTVAAVLANDPEVALATRRKIREIARVMGYRADARVTELMAHLRRGRPSHSVCNLAWVNTNPERDSWTRYDYRRTYLDGARLRSEQLGYSLIEIWMAEPNLTISKFTRQLKDRGIRGLIFPIPQEIPLLKKFDFGGYSVVGLCNGTSELRMNNVCEHWVHNMLVLCESLHRLGYRRPALMISETADLEGLRGFSSTFLRFQQRFFSEQIIPVPVSLDKLQGRDECLSWARKWRPDVVIGHSHELFDRFIKDGFRIPEDFGYVHTHLGPDTVGWAGIDPKQPNLGAAAVESLVALIHRNETGLPNIPKMVALSGTWCDGWTAPARKPD